MTNAEKNIDRAVFAIAVLLIIIPTSVIILLLCGVEIHHLSSRGTFIVKLALCILVPGLLFWSFAGKETDEELEQRRRELLIKRTQERNDQIYLKRLCKGKDCGVKPANKKTVLPTNWRQEIQDFVEIFISPYAKIIERLGLLDPIIKVLEWLEKYGDQSSIGNELHAVQFKNSTKENPNVKALENTTLLSHSLTTARIMIEDLHRNCIDFRIEVGKNLLCGLGHDLGKIEELKRYDSHLQEVKHWIISKQLLEEIIPDQYRPKVEILNAVINHHGQGDSPLETRLIKADRSARSKELIANNPQAEILFTGGKDKDAAASKVINNETPKYNIMDLKDIDMDRCLSIIGEKINAFNGSKHEALMIKGIVYVHPILISKTIGLLSSNDLVKEYCKDPQKAGNVQFTFRQLFNDHIPNKIGKSFIGQKYQVVMKNGDTLNPAYFMPIKISAFPDHILADAEERLRNSAFGSQIKKVEVLCS